VVCRLTIDELGILPHHPAGESSPKARQISQPNRLILFTNAALAKLIWLIVNFDTDGEV
jgi:hypothetical protein